MNIFELSSLIISFLYIIYDTEAVPSWFSLFYFDLKNYQDYKKTSINNVNFLEYLNIKYNNFLTNLICCPPCISVWLILILDFLFNLSYVNLGYELLLVWIGYPLLKFILKKLYE